MIHVGFIKNLQTYLSIIISYNTKLPIICSSELTGFARVGAMCDLDSASVVEDHGGFQSINTAAHELGHR